MSKPYRVWVEIEGADPGESPEDRQSERVLVAEFDSWEEALVFRTEIEHRYAPLATGEAEIVDEVFTPDLLTPGD